MPIRSNPLVRLTLAATFALGACAHGPDAPNLALWRIVSQGCEASPAHPVAGLQCDPAYGVALLKDRCGPDHYLVIPLARRPGIESPELLDPREPNVIAYAWAQRGRSLGLDAAMPVPANADLALAINSRYGRSQEQLHVHIDALRPEVRSALDALPRPVAPGTMVELAGHRYRVDPLERLEPAPFAALAAAWGAHSQDERAHLTLALVQDRQGGFLLLSDRADLWRLDRGHAEELLRERHC